MLLDVDFGVETRASIAPQRHRKQNLPLQPTARFGASIAPQRHRKANGLAGKFSRITASIAPQRHRKTTLPDRFVPPGPGLNRSSEASKVPEGTPMTPVAGPQSLLRGIERRPCLTASYHPALASIAPQRHRKPSARACASVLSWCLNRSSEASKVGEREQDGDAGAGASIAPQRHRKWMPARFVGAPASASIAPQRHRKTGESRRRGAGSRGLNRSSEASKVETHRKTRR